MVVSKLTVFRMAVQMISVGESTGNLDKMLDKVADFYEQEVETAMSGMTKLIELVMVFWGRGGRHDDRDVPPVFKMGSSIQ